VKPRVLAIVVLLALVGLVWFFFEGDAAVVRLASSTGKNGKYANTTTQWLEKDKFEKTIKEIQKREEEKHQTLLRKISLLEKEIEILRKRK